jgi:23S rRNA U2552 (ribose-2'-O)-methylase RlmE/FtsJ
MGELNDLGLKYGTDKSSSRHGYLDIFEKYLAPIKNEEIKILEIGIFNGASLRMWEEYFKNGKIYAIDIDPEKLLNFGRVKSYVANQEKREDLLNVISHIGECDIIIDDGGHTMLQQQVTLGCLFPHLRQNGIYCIEDLHTSYLRKRRGFNKDETTKTTLNVLVQLSQKGTIDSDYMENFERLYIENNLVSCEIIKAIRSEIVFLKKC